MGCHPTMKTIVDRFRGGIGPGGGGVVRSWVRCVVGGWVGPE